MADNILEMRSITKTFPGVKALENVNLDVRRGEIHAICGENGAGKSTLMKVLSGVYPTGSYDGEIVYDGQAAHVRRTSATASTSGIVIIHQELALVPYLSIAENIFLGNERRGRGGLIDWNLANADAAKLLAEVGLDENPVTPVGQLGVGKQQLVEIAKALSKDVRLLILDEPTAALNDNDSEHLLDLLRQLQERGITSIMISHKLNEITAISDRVTVIRDGKTVETLDAGRRRGHPGADHPRHGRPRPRELLPRPRLHPGRGGHAGRGLDRVAPDPGPQGRRQRQLHRARRRGRRHRRAHGRRAHRAGDEHLRPLLRPRHLRPGVHPRQGDQGAQRRPRRSTTASPTPRRTASGTA